VNISRTVNNRLVAALVVAKDTTRTTCPTCLGKRVVIQISPQMHDAWASELANAIGTPVATIREYGEFRVMQRPHLPEGSLAVTECWDCSALPSIPDDPDALARFLQ